MLYKKLREASYERNVLMKYKHLAKATKFLYLGGKEHKQNVKERGTINEHYP